MAKPDLEEVLGALSALDFLRDTHQMVAWPVELDGVRVVCLGRKEPAASGSPGAFDCVPVMVISTDELAAKMDLTEARS